MRLTMTPRVIKFLWLLNRAMWKAPCILAEDLLFHTPSTSKNLKATKSLFSDEGKDGSEPFDLEIVSQQSEWLSPFPEGILCKCSGNCFKQSILKRMWILERYKRAHMPEYLSISSNCTDWSNKMLLDLSIQSCLYSRRSTSDIYDTIQTPSLSKQ